MYNCFRVRLSGVDNRISSTAASSATNCCPLDPGLGSTPREEMNLARLLFAVLFNEIFTHPSSLHHVTRALQLASPSSKDTVFSPCNSTRRNLPGPGHLRYRATQRQSLEFLVRIRDLKNSAVRLALKTAIFLCSVRVCRS